MPTGLILDHQNKMYMVRHDYVAIDQNSAVDFSDPLKLSFYCTPCFCNDDRIQAVAGRFCVNLGKDTLSVFRTDCQKICSRP